MGHGLKVLRRTCSKLNACGKPGALCVKVSTIPTFTRFSNNLYIDPSMIVLGLVQTCFEGSMYLFVFLWVPSMQETAAPGEELPLGLIFSAFMVSMMLGSLLYKCLVTYANNGESTLVLHAKLSSSTLLVAAFALAVNNIAHDSRWRFWAFCLFEACVGIYYPVQGMLRGTMIQNDHRATVSDRLWWLNDVLKLFLH